MRRAVLFGILFPGIILVLSGSAARGEDSPKKEPAPSRRVAVINFTQNNTTGDIARIVRNTVEMQLFNRGSLEVLERNQIDLIVSERKKQFAECKDEKCAAVLGKLLSADYVVLGSVDKLDGYTVNIQVVDVKNKTVIAADSEEAKEIQDIKRSSEKVTKRIAEKIEDRLSGRVKGKAVFTVDFVTAFPAGYMSQRLKNGYGVSARAGWENLFFKDLTAFAEYEYLNFSGKGNQVLSAAIMPAAVGISYRLNVWKLVVVPGASFGMSYNSLRIYKDVYKAMKSTARVIQPMVSAEVMAEYSIRGPFFLHAGCQYRTIFEKGGNISFLTLRAGPGIRF